ncbi:MAG: stage III sporulation protein AB [Bacillota bacterium]|jgi:stage III sporulation protein AB
MLKFIGALLVIISFGMIGTVLGRNMTKHADELRQLQFGLSALETEIMYALTPLPQALMIVSKQTRGVVGRFFAEVSYELNNRQGQTAGEAWSKALEKISPYLMLTEGELCSLEQFGQGLGSSDREDQLKRLTSIKMQLAAREKTVETEKGQFQKIWQTLGWASGLVVTLLFI